MAGLTSASHNAASLVAVQASIRPASPAIISHEEIITYGQLSVAVGVVARHLREQGVAPGQVVGVSMGQNAPHIITLLAVAQVGAVSLPLHVAVPAERRAIAARRFGASWVVSGRDEMQLAGTRFVSLARLSFDGISIAPDRDIYPAESDSPFRIAISSGTSGDPKGVVMTHGLRASRNRHTENEVNDCSRVIPMDLNFVIGFGPAMAGLSAGACLVMPRSFSAAHMMQAIVSHCVTHISISPAQAQQIVDQFALEGIHCPSLVSLRIVGGALSPHLFEGLRKKISPNVFVGYGSTESGSIALATPEILKRQPGTVGRVRPWAQVEIVGDDDNPLPAGKIGQVRIRSEDQVSGYLANEENNRKQFRDGWFYPGDLGGFDEEGLLYIEGRADEQLNIGGLKINPEDVEGAMAFHPGVMESGAFLFSAEEGGELLAIAVLLREGYRIEDIRSHAIQKLGPLAPAHYFVVQSLPRTLTGKLRRTELTAQFSRPTNLQ